MSIPYRRSFEQTDSPSSGLSALHLKQVLLKHLGYYLRDQIAECAKDEMARVEESVSMAAENNHTIISFNWDLLVEVASEGLAIDVSDGGELPMDFRWPSRMARSISPKLSDPNFIECKTVSTSIALAGTTKMATRFMSVQITRLMRIIESSLRSREKSVVEPTTRKSYLSGWIGLQWQRALQMLRGADEIVVIGYSLPDTDFRPRILLQLACWDKSLSPKGPICQ